MDEKCPQRRQLMHSAAFVDDARRWERMLVDREVGRSGLKSDAARSTVARRTAVPRGTLLSLRKNRLKNISAWCYARLRAGVIHELEAELGHLEHELAILRQTGAHPDSDATAAVATDIAHVREALGLTPSDPSDDRGMP